MKGLEESRALYERYGAPMIESQFPAWAGRIAVGLAGHGSECFGYDDELSRDHDFPQGFCLWLDDETDRAIGVALARAYRALPFEGAREKSALGGNSRGVRRIADFYSRYTGSAGAPESLEQWLNLPSHALAEATNGAVWRDDQGLFSEIRLQLLHGMPEDVRLKKLAARIITMAQAGQYNYPRCVRHGEQGAAMLAMGEFVDAACGAIFLLNRRHMPYYKWQLRALGELETLGQLRDALEYLLTADNDADGRVLKSAVVEDICAAVIAELKAQHLTHGSWDYLEPHAYEIAEHIVSPSLRSLHIMEG